jgi:predicted RNA-binding Zn-ribbon protein involved in translation (DUF1610 family)
MPDNILLALTLNFTCPSCGQLNTKAFVDYVLADSRPCASCGFEIPIHNNKELSLGLKVLAKRITEK